MSSTTADHIDVTRTSPKAADRIEEILAENTRLRFENAALRLQLAFVEPSIRRATGMCGEAWTAMASGGCPTPCGAGFDLNAKGQRLEIKTSSLIPCRASGYRWGWERLFGGKKVPKVYDRLVLLGEVDDRFRELYSLSPEQPFIIFDVPYDTVRSELGERTGFKLNTDPFQIQRKYPWLWGYRVTLEEFVATYGGST